MKETEAFSMIWNMVKRKENYVPREYQTIGGMWTVDSYKFAGVTAQSMDEGYSSKLISEKVVAFRYHNGTIDYMKGNQADLVELAEKMK